MGSRFYCGFYVAKKYSYRIFSIGLRGNASVWKWYRQRSWQVAVSPISIIADSSTSVPLRFLYG
jgi:hypothetical protein